MAQKSSYFMNGPTNQRYPREFEGYDRAIGLGPGDSLTCGTEWGASGVSVVDYRGVAPMADGSPRGKVEGYSGRRAIEWETAPASDAGTDSSLSDPVFTWIGGSQVRPLRPSFPFVTASLIVNGVRRLQFPLGFISAYSFGFTSTVDGYTLSFEPRRNLTLVEPPHRYWESQGISGFYRLQVPASHLNAERRVRIRVELDPPPQGAASFFYVSPRTDALRLDLITLRDEVVQLQYDLVNLRQSHQMLYARVYPELFPKLIQGERSVVHLDEIFHYHPATLTVLRSGEAVITTREGSDHITKDGRIVAFRSTDGGKTWSPKQLLFNLGNTDHRSSPLFELPDGQWLVTDYRCGSQYNAKGIWDIPNMVGPTLFCGWSKDQGKTWEFADEPLTVPGMNPYAETERHMIQLPSGRLLVAANYMELAEDGIHAKPHVYQIALFSSDDNGRHWSVISKAPDHPFVIGECTLLFTREGRVLMLARTQPSDGTDYVERGAILQSVSLDQGATWSPFEPTGMSSMASPAHLLQLADGRILCTHASRYYPGSIYVTVSNDGGRTWDTANTKTLAMDLQNVDSCYPTTGQLPDGTLLTTWYSNLFAKFYVSVLRYRPEQL